MNGVRKCGLDSCPDSAVTYFAQRDFCLHHFVSYCYEELDRLDARRNAPQADYSESAALKAFVEECSQCALEVSLKCEHLDNLQRARLLDILLWAGELLPKASANARSTGESVCVQGTRSGPLINKSHGSVGYAIVGSGAGSLKKATG